MPHLQKRISVVGNGNIDVGNRRPPRKPGDRIGLRGGNDPAGQKTERPWICGAMSQQRCNIGSESAPQEFVRLVGCRDPNARPELRVRPQPTLTKS
jgi:hypothetical protein